MPAFGFTATVNVELPITTLQESLIVERNSPVIDRAAQLAPASCPDRHPSVFIEV